MTTEPTDEDRAAESVRARVAWLDIAVRCPRCEEIASTGEDWRCEHPGDWSPGDEHRWLACETEGCGALLELPDVALRERFTGDA